MVFFQDNDEKFTSPPYPGPGSQQKVKSTRMTEEELLASEMFSLSRRSKGLSQTKSGPEASGTAR